MILKNGKRIDGLGDNMPIGSIVEYNGTDIPDGWEILPGDANVYIGPTEPADGQEVWIKKSNNLLNVSSSLEVTLSTDIPCMLKKGTYTLAIDGATTDGTGYESYVGFKNASGSTFLYTYIHYSTKKVTFTLEQDAVSVTLWSQKYWDISKGKTTTFKNLRIAAGSERLPYDSYINKEIYVKNDNGVYEEFYHETNLENYSTREQRIGTWLGKPLYRKVIETTAPSVVGTTTAIATLSSEIQVVKLDGYLHSNANCRYNLNSWFDSTDYIYTFSDMNNHQIKMKVSLDAYKSTKVVLVIEYTKTTD
jgi:hypothetical protein